MFLEQYSCFNNVRVVVISLNMGDFLENKSLWCRHSNYIRKIGREEIQGNARLEELKIVFFSCVCNPTRSHWLV